MDEPNQLPEPEKPAQPEPPAMDAVSPFQPVPPPLTETVVPTPIPPAAAVSPYYTPTQDERTFATLAHALQMPGWWIAPLVILLVKRESRFVKFHAAQVLLLQAVHLAVTITTVVIFLAMIFASIPRGGGAPSTEPPTGFFLFMPFMWLAMFGMYVLILVFTILFSIKAGKGEWAEYPVLGRLAKYMLNM